MGVFSLQEGKELEVEMLGADKTEIKDFLHKIKLFEVKNNEDNI